MPTRTAISLVVLLIVLPSAALTGNLIAWAATLASAAWLAWVAADRVMQQVLDRPFDLDGTQPEEP